MTQDEDHLTENNCNINTQNELPARPFAITMEFPLSVIMMGISLSGVAISNILLYRTCLHSLHYPEEECRGFLQVDKNNQTQKLEEEVQKYVTIVSTVRSLLEGVVPAILSLFLGVWSDTHGRKPLIIWPIFGITMSSVLMVVYSMMDDLGPWWYILTVVPYSLCGGITIWLTGAFCYINDITSSDSRSLRMTIMDSALSAGSVIGALLSAPLLRLVGNVYLILIATVLNVIAYVFTSVWIRESLRGALQGGLTSIFDLLLVKEMVRECFKRRPNHGRRQILMLVIANSLSIFILYGLFSEYMYTREKLHWGLNDYTTYSAVSTTISFVGSFLGIALWQKLFKFGDLVVVQMAFLGAIMNYVIKAFAVTSWHMYFAAGISLFKGLSAPLIRSFLTKVLPIVDIVKVFALLSAIEGLIPLISPPLYNVLYEYTISVFPGAMYLLSAAITVVCVGLTGFVQFYRRNVTTPYQVLEEATRTI